MRIPNSGVSVLSRKGQQIDFWKFIFAVYIVIYHYLGHARSITTGGYISVEFFFIVSGYFMMHQFETYMSKDGEKEKYPLYHIQKRFARLYPIYIFAYLISLAVFAITREASFVDVIAKVYQSFPEMFMLRIEGRTSVNGVSWFVAAMLIAGLIIAGLLTLSKKFYSLCLAPLSVILIYSAFFYSTGKIHLITSNNLTPYINDAIFRAFAGMSLGVFMWEIVRLCKELKIKPAVISGGAILGNALIIVVVAFSFRNYHGFCDFWYIFLFFVSVILINLGTNNNQKSSNVERYIEKVTNLSYPIFLIHEPVWKLFRAYEPIDSTALTVVIIVVIVILLSRISDVAIDGISRRLLFIIRKGFIKG